MSQQPTATGSLRLKQRALALAQPLTVHLELTYRCNWRCVFCYNPRRFDRHGLSVAEWVTVLDDLRSLGTLTVTLTGGEPLAHPGFLEIARAARQRAFALRVFTNGGLVTDRMADALAELGPAGVELSLHGARAETHDQATNTPGSFLALLAALDRLQARKLPVLLKTPITRLNQDELDDMIALAAGRGLPYRVDPTLTPRDDGDRAPLSYAASRDALERVYRRVAEMGQLPGDERFEGGLNCGLGRITLAVDPEGEVYPCLQWRHRSLGNVRHTPLASLWHLSAARLEAAETSRAANQLLLQLGGSVSRFPFCPAVAFQRTGDALRPDEGHLLRAQVADAVRRTVAE